MSIEYSTRRKIEPNELLNTHMHVRQLTNHWERALARVYLEGFVFTWNQG